MRRDERVTDEMVEVACKAITERRGFVWPDEFSEDEKQTGRENMRTALTAALEVEQPVAVEVEKLDWTKTLDRYRGSERREQWVAKTPWGGLYIWHYQFDYDEVARGPKFTVGAHQTPFEPTGIEYDTLEAAKAAAQQDYETRIRSAIVEVPVEPDYWTSHNNFENMLGRGVTDKKGGVVWDFATQEWVNADVPLYTTPPSSPRISASSAEAGGSPITTKGGDNGA